MRYRPLGKSGLVVSVVGLGCNNFGSRIGKDETRAVVEAAVDVGITLFDTANTYGDGDSERFLGQAVKGRRDEVLIATKFGGRMEHIDSVARGSRLYIRRAIDASLERLGTDYVDLYQMHVPDPATPIEETLAALDELVAEGKVRYVGSSNFTAWQVVEAEWVARDRGYERFISAQNRYSLLERETEGELLPACQRYGIGVLPYFPLASGLLTGKYRRGKPAPEGTRLAGRDDALTDEKFDVVESLALFADDRGRTLLEVAIDGLAARPAVASVIAGATKPEQVRANAEAGEWEPSADDLAALRRVLDG